MSKYKIEYDEASCIGCGACTVQCPENWELVETSAGEMKAKPGTTELDEIGKNNEAADVCPLDCIKVVSE